MNAAVIINFVTSAVTFVFGILLVTGIVFPGGEGSTKLMLGIVLLIYSVYRFINSYTKLKQNKLIENIERLESERDKFLKNK
ncbi:MAG TPA: hypothetical protein PL089_01400 [Ignavibacteria bacterium]|nr:hypothetical protein [Ignavibacteria bacterium]